jgi:hypothetical protein
MEDLPQGPEWTDLTPETTLASSRSARFGWLAGVGAAVVVLVVIGATAFLTVEEPVPPPATGGTTTTGATSTTAPSTTVTSLAPEETEGPRFIPIVSSTGSGQSSLDVAFLDGTTANLSWPEGLDLLSNGVGTDGWGALNSLGSGTSRTLLAIPEPADSVVERFGVGELLATYPDGKGGAVEFRRFPVDETVDYLVFDMGAWTVLVYDYQSGPDGRMSDSSRETWARSLSGEISPEGFLSLSAEEPLVLAGPGASPPVSLGFESPNGIIGITLFPCSPNEIIEDETQSITWCDQSGKMLVAIHSTDVEFRNAVREGLTISDIRESPWGTSEDPPETTNDMQVVELDESSIVLTYPADWQLAEENLTPNLADPREVFSLGTFALTPGGPNCAQAPTQSLHDMDGTDVFLTVQERWGVGTLTSGFDPRPDEFGPTPGSADNVFFECLDPEERSDLSAIHWIWFTDAGRYFHVLVAIGRDADPSDISAVWETLDRLVILPTD